jgi:hypothetical protein
MAGRFTLSKPILTETSEIPAPPVAARKFPRNIPDEDDESELPRVVRPVPVRSIPVHAPVPHYSDEDVEEVEDEPTPQMIEQSNAQYEDEPVEIQTRPVDRKIVSEDSFWNYIERLSWRDKTDDPNFDVNRKKVYHERNLTIPDQEAFAEFLLHTVDAMNQKLTSAGIYGELTDENERKAVCSHIVGKGSVFYALTMDDPCFAQYLFMDTKKEYHNMLALIQI